MILTAGLTPAWQQILVFDHLRFGEVNRAREAHWVPSGKVFNAGIAAHRLGGPSLTLATVGGPPLAEIDREFAALGVPHRWIRTQAATRVCTTLLDRASHRITELVENGRPLSPAEIQQFREDFAEEVPRAAVAVIIGSLPLGSPESLYRELVQAARCPVVLDFRGQGLLSVLDLKPLVVKPNREELAQTLGTPLDSEESFRQAMQSLNQRGAQWVVITQGADAVWLSALGKFYRLTPPMADEIVNPIGCGDTLAAGIAWAVRDGRPMPQCVAYGMAAAAANLRQLFPGRINPEGLDERAAAIRIEEC